jgi:hypothetical protein
MEAPHRRIKPGLDTPFHIDYEWWSREDRDLRRYLISHLPPEKHAQFQNAPVVEVDWVDPDTAEVRRLDALQIALQEAINQDEFVGAGNSLVDAVFRAFLANGNQPQTPNELGEITRRRPETILRTLGGVQVYNGLRPYNGG